MKIGEWIQQSTGYKAFIPFRFPPKDQILLDSKCFIYAW